LDLLYGANAIDIMAVISGALFALVTSFNEFVVVLKLANVRQR
jgi:ABC-type spermidine/putrescine transport system permease subunit II